MKLSSLQQFGDVRNVKAIAEKVFKARRRFHLYRATLCVGAVFAVARYLSVCPSVALVYCIDTVEDIVKVLSRPGSLSFYFFYPQYRYPIPRGTPSAEGEAEYTRCVKICDFRLKSPFILETVRDRPRVATEVNRNS